MASIMGSSAWLLARYPAADAVTATPPARQASADAKLRRAAHPSNGTATQPTAAVAHAAAATGGPDGTRGRGLPLLWAATAASTAAVASAALSQRCFTTR